MSRILTSLILSAIMLCAALPVQGYIYQYSSTNSVQIKWPVATEGSVTTINIALSTSLSSPPANIKAGSDVLGAARRALRRWSDAARIQFVESSTSLDTVNTSGSDGVSLITVANNPTNAAFTSGRLGRTRVVFEPTSGRIQEGDLAISPNTQFSTDGTPNTYDLESTFVHELGHLLGLDHSGVVGATMQPRQGLNFVDPAFTIRTLSDDDLAGIRSIYGQRTPAPVGAIAGHVNAIGANVWAENFYTGRVEGGSITDNNGNYRIEQLTPTDYRVRVEYLDEPVVAREISVSPPYSGIANQAPFQATEAQVNIPGAGVTSTLNLNVNVTVPSINPRILGVNALQGAPVQLSAGRAYRFAVGGNGLDNVPLTTTGFSLAAPFMTIDPASFARENPANYGITEPNYGIVSFNLIIADTAKFGDYTLRLRSNSGEVAFLSGALALDPYTNNVELNPLENNGFFVRQQYLDFLFREPDTDGFNAWLGVLNRCDQSFSPDCDRPTVSSAFFRSTEFQLKGYFVYRFYKLSFNRLPAYAEIIPDMLSVTGATSAEVFQKRAQFANNWVQRQAFAATYSGLSNTAFVNTLMNRYDLQTINTPDPSNPDTGGKVALSRVNLISRLDAGTLTRAQVVRAIVESDEVFALEFNPGFVSMQYFGYLKRDPEIEGFNAWLNYLNTHPGDFRTMVVGFANSKEYRSRFGQP
ncbi:MAG TPA: matrixin family metalloprotease [Pyrinomonadaceae bacterium]|nr:matrixin family metalloprotease [Pyrinomonadaceae bacterium]